MSDDFGGAEMDDWKLNTAPVVRLKRPSERFVTIFVYLLDMLLNHQCNVY